MIARFAAGPANIELVLDGYTAPLVAAAAAFLERFPPRPNLPTWRAQLRRSEGQPSHRGSLCLELGPIDEQGWLAYPELDGLPLRHGAPRTVVHGLMGWVCHHLRQRDGRLFHAAGKRTASGTVMIVGRSGAGKSTLSAALPGVELGDEAVAVSPWLQAQACLLPGQRLAETWQPAPLCALIVPRQGGHLSLRQLAPAEAASVVVEAMVRLRGDRIEKDLDWTASLLRRLPVFELQWSLEANPWDVLGPSLAAAC